MTYLSSLIRKAFQWVSVFTAIVFSHVVFSDSLHVAVATNFIQPAKQVAKDFEKETGHKLQLSFASSGKIFAQIQHNAPYDIFLSADQIKPKKLIEEQRALEASFTIYTKGKLALWSTSPFTTTKLNSIILNAQRIAIANPKFAPYGEAAIESLQSLSLWEASKTKIVRGESVGQAFQFTYSQNTEIGLIALSQAINKSELGYHLEIPAELHNDILQAGVILSSTKKTILAHQFMAFLMRADIQAKIALFGYDTPIN